MICHICGCSEGTIHKAREMMFGTREEFDYFECSNCGCLQLMNVPEDLGAYYPSDRYYSLTQYLRIDLHSNPLIEYVFRKRNHAQAWGTGGLWGWVAKRRPAPEFAHFPLVLPEVLNLPPVKKSGLDTRILDVGCGKGFFLLVLSMAGFRRLEGVDPFTTDASYPHRGIRIRGISPEEITGEQYDVITLNHSLEHMPDTARALAAASRLLAPDGICLVDVPVVDSEAWERYGVNWVDLDAPRHLFLHTERSMRIAAEKAGMKITQVKHMNVSHSFFASEMYRRDISLYKANSNQTHSTAEIFTPEEMADFEAQSARAQERGAWARFLMTSAS